MKGIAIKSMLSALLLVGAGLLCRAEKQNITQMYARGVYWPWEKTGTHAARAGMDEWQFAEHFMKHIKEQWHCNVVWFVNGPKDRERICKIAEKYGITVLLGTDFANVFAHGVNDIGKLDELAKSTVDKVAHLPAFGAYVLKDEARRKEMRMMDDCRKRLHQLDPAHPSIVVTMTHDTESYLRNSGFPIICSDIYHFGAPRSPHIPNTPSRSKNSYSNAVYDLVSQCREYKKIPWVMPQAFTEIWGPWWIDEKENVVVGAGAYYNWRNPTPAEVRWQTWEAVRAGAKGVVFFSPLLGGNNRENWDGSGEMPEAVKKRIASNRAKNLPLAKETFNTGMPGSLTYANGRSTPQGDAMGNAFKRLAHIEDILKELELSRIPFAFADAPGNSASFVHHRHRQFKHLYAVIVNNDTEKAQTITCHIPGHTQKVSDAISGAVLDVVPSSINSGDNMKQIKVKLAAGDGAVLKLDMKPQPGALFLSETFNGRHTIMELVNCSRRQHHRGFGMGLEWKVTRADDCPVDKDAYILIDKLDDRKASGLFQSLETIDKNGEMVMIKIDGRCPAAEDIVISCVNDKGEAGWNKTSEYHLPMAIPPNTKQVKILLKDRASVSGVSLWRTKK